MQITPIKIPLGVDDAKHLTTLKWHLDDMFVRE
jgi:hypothetical protein